MPALDRPAPGWVIATCEWIARRWLCPQGLSSLWLWQSHRLLRTIFDEPVAPVTWRHIFGGGDYESDCNKLYGVAS